MEKSYIYKLTDDDWYKNHFGNKVKLMYHGDITPCNVGTVRTYRVSVFGNDDFGMVFDSCIEMEVTAMFFVLSHMKMINKEDLKKLGFKVF